MPTLSETIVGHKKQQAQLLHDIAKDNVAHAYLFSGHEHIGKSTIARWFTVELFASTKTTEEKKLIGTQVERLIHPDFLALDMLWIEGIHEDWTEISRFSNVQQKLRSKAPTAKTDSISIDDVHFLIDQLHETPQGAHHCCLITNVERLHREAANALLKIIEEPPSRVVFLLTTSDQRSLLPTLTSRTRTILFDRVPRALLTTLIDSENQDEEELLLHLSNGAPGTLRLLQEDPEALRYAKQLHTRARSFWRTTSLSERLSLILPAQESRTSAEEFLLHLALTLREHGSIEERASWVPEYTQLVKALQTNTNRGLAFEAFTLAVSRGSC